VGGQGRMLTELVRTALNETATSATNGFSASDGQTSVNAVSQWGATVAEEEQAE